MAVPCGLDHIIHIDGHSLLSGADIGGKQWAGSAGADTLRRTAGSQFCMAAVVFPSGGIFDCLRVAGAAVGADLVHTDGVFPHFQGGGVSADSLSVVGELCGLFESGGCHSELKKQKRQTQASSVFLSAKCPKTGCCPYFLQKDKRMSK